MTFEERIEKIEKALTAYSESGTKLQLVVLCEMTRQLDRIATQLEKITSLKYTEDA